MMYVMRKGFKRRLNRLGFAAAVCALMMAPACAAGEISTNLEVQREFNTYGEVIRETFVDDHGNRALAEDMGYCYVEHRYNSFPLVIETTFHDISGAHVNTAQGYASIRYKWSGFGNFLQKDYVDLAGNLVTGEDGYATERHDYQGDHIARIGYYDPQGNPVRAKGTYAVMVNTIDRENGNHLKREYFDENGQYMLGDEGYAYVEREYDKKVLLSETFYDENGSLVYVPQKGYARYVATLNKNRRAIREEYFGEDGQMINCRAGYAAIEYEYLYATSDRPCVVRYYDENNQA
ncbi:MAG: hypothetical protein IJ381_05085, partial [Clostridia bacterium]|nr:hypothetical protein [Clostridia bacterium]